MWLANLTGDAVTVDIGRKFAGGRKVILDEHHFVRAADRAEFLDRANVAVKAPRLTLEPYAVCRITWG